MRELGCFCKIEEIGEYYKRGIRVFQTFAMSPDNKGVPSPSIFRLLPSYDDCVYIIHCPNWINLVDGERLKRKSIDNILSHVEYCSRGGIRYIVTNAGQVVLRGKAGEGVKVDIDKFLDTCDRINRKIKGSGVKILFKNSNDTLGLGIEDVSRAVQVFNLYGWSMGMCLDMLRAHLRGVCDFDSFAHSSDIINVCALLPKFGMDLSWLWDFMRKYGSFKVLEGSSDDITWFLDKVYGVEVK